MIKRIKNHLSLIARADKKVLYWSCNTKTKKNIGDAINPYLFEKIFQKEIVSFRSILNIGFPEVYSFIGSVLDNNSIKNLVVLGSGFHTETSNVKVIPKKVLACRGPLTRDKFLNLGLKVPEVYGDPAILLPKYYNPEVSKCNKIGIIPHYVDKDLAIVRKLVEKNQFLRIDVQTEDWRDFIKDIKSCKFIISSSLHGVILAHAYGVPAVWAEFSKNVLGDGFKFNDYFRSVNLMVDRLIINDAEIPLKALDDMKTLPDLTSLTEKLNYQFEKFSSSL